MIFLYPIIPLNQSNIHRLPLAATGHSPAIQEKPEENAEGGDDAGGGAWEAPMVGKREFFLGKSYTVHMGLSGNIPYEKWLFHWEY